MKLKNLQLVNYRNYDKLYIEFNDRINLLLGSNGQGKTNIAEAIYLLAFGKSFRTNVNYRNYDKLYIEFNDRINLLLGSNGQGKTNIAEAIYLLAFGKSFRTNRDRELIKFNTENLYVGGGYEKNDRKGEWLK